MNNVEFSFHMWMVLQCCDGVDVSHSCIHIVVLPTGSHFKITADVNTFMVQPLTFAELETQEEIKK